MDAMSLGLVVARGLATLLLVKAASLGLYVLFMPVMRLDWTRAATSLLDTFTYGIFAAILWRGSERFGLSKASVAGKPPLSFEAVQRLVIMGIGIFIAAKHLPSAIDWAWSYFAPRPAGVNVPYPWSYTPGDLITFGIAVVVIIFAAKGVTLRRAIAYPRLEVDEDSGEQ